MRKLVALLAAAIVLSAAGVALSSGGPQEKLASQLRLYGGGTYGPCFDGGFCFAAERTFAVDVHVDGKGNGAVYGNWENGVAGQFVNRGVVTCARLDGDVMIVGGILTHAGNPAANGWSFIWYARDNGTPDVAADQASVSWIAPSDGTPDNFPMSFPQTCPDHPFDNAPRIWTNVRGDVVVQDDNAAPKSDSTQVVVRRADAVQVTLASDLTGSASSFGSSIANAVQMAVDAHSTIRGFPIHVNVVDAPCGDPAADVATAEAVAANLQNVGVLGQLCSAGFDQSLPVYEAAGLVTLTGSATNTALPSFGPTVFDRTAVDDRTFDSWYAAVSHLPGDLAWRQEYTRRFGTAPTDFADLYYDAAGLLIRNLERVATIERGSLVVNRAAFAQAVRGTTDYWGVTCTVTLDPATGNRINDPVALARCARGR